MNCVLPLELLGTGHPHPYRPRFSIRVEKLDRNVLCLVWIISSTMSRSSVIEKMDQGLVGVYLRRMCIQTECVQCSSVAPDVAEHSCL